MTKRTKFRKRKKYDRRGLAYLGRTRVWKNKEKYIHFKTKLLTKNAAISRANLALASEFFIHLSYFLRK